MQAAPPPPRESLLPASQATATSSGSGPATRSPPALVDAVQRQMEQGFLLVPKCLPPLPRGKESGDSEMSCVT